MSHRTIHVRATVGPDRTIHIPMPELAVGEVVEVTVEAPSATGLPAPKAAGGESALDIIESLPPGRSFKSAEEVDAYIRQERDSWER